MFNLSKKHEHEDNCSVLLLLIFLDKVIAAHINIKCMSALHTAIFIYVYSWNAIHQKKGTVVETIDERTIEVAKKIKWVKEH